MFRRTIVLLFAALAANVFLSYHPAQAGKPAPPPATKLYTLHWVASEEGVPDSNAGGINDAGDVVGTAWWPEGTIEAFQYTAGLGMQNLNVVAGMPPVDSDWRLLNATDINNSGQIVGTAEYRKFLRYEDGYPVYEQDWGVFRYTPGSAVEILSGRTTGGVYKFENATSINDSGVMTGIAEEVTTKRRFVFTYAYPGTQVLTEIAGPLGGVGVWQPNAINNFGQIVGAGRIDGITNALRYDPPPTNKPISLGWLKTQGTEPAGVANDINSNVNGVVKVTGEITTKGLAVVHAFVHDGTTMKDLGALGGLNTRGNGINNAGVVVGEVSTTGAFVYTSTGGLKDLKAITELDGYSPLSLRAFKINNNNWILGELGGQACLLEPTAPLP